MSIVFSTKQRFYADFLSPKVFGAQTFLNIVCLNLADRSAKGRTGESGPLLTAQSVVLWLAGLGATGLGKKTNIRFISFIDCVGEFWLRCVKTHPSGWITAQWVALCFNCEP